MLAIMMVVVVCTLSDISYRAILAGQNITYRSVLNGSVVSVQVCKMNYMIYIDISAATKMETICDISIRRRSLARFCSGFLLWCCWLQLHLLSAGL